VPPPLFLFNTGWAISNQHFSFFLRLKQLLPCLSLLKFHISSCCIFSLMISYCHCDAASSIDGFWWCCCCCCFEGNVMLATCYFSNRCHLALRLEAGLIGSLFLNMGGVLSFPGSRGCEKHWSYVATLETHSLNKWWVFLETLLSVSVVKIACSINISCGTHSFICPFILQACIKSPWFLSVMIDAEKKKH
jgi:hypothetical protein